MSEYASLNDRLDSIATSLEKEHVLLALRFDIAGRKGILLCDPGYHVGRVITVMMDGKYPHTGWFTQSEENNNKKEYCYSFCSVNANFIEWTERNTRSDGVSKSFSSLIFIARPYLTAVDVTERRNLVYDFRSLLSRDPKGHVTAGIYFKVKENYDEFTVFYQEGGKKRIKMNFSSFLKPSEVRLKIYLYRTNKDNIHLMKSIFKILFFFAD